MADRDAERLTKTTQGNWIPIELFVHAIEGWGEDTKRLVTAA
jgi:hypothetical protein